MEISYKVIGSRRKQMAYKIAEITGKECRYLFLPTYAYEIGDFNLGKDGTLTIADTADENEVGAVLDGLAEAGFEIEGDESTWFDDEEETEEDQEPENTLTVSLPAASFDDRIFANLDRLIENKAILLKHAFDTDSLEYKVSEEEVQFPWFTPEDPEDGEAYCSFISALFEMAKNQKRINNKLETSDNEKYAFRCFLLRLGFIGVEYKKTRKVLLRNLDGSSAFRHGAPAPSEKEVPEGGDSNE